MVIAAAANLKFKYESESEDDDENEEIFHDNTAVTREAGIATEEGAPSDM